MDAAGAVVGLVGHERVDSLDGRESSRGLNQFRVLRRLPNVENATSVCCLLAVRSGIQRGKVLKTALGK